VHDLDRGLKCRPTLVEHCTKWTTLGKRWLCEIDFKNVNKLTTLVGRLG